jgi:hypothetical protein
MNERTVIEINGVKMEIDLRHARRVDQLRVGDRVKVLKKEYNEYKVYPGTIVGFEPFKELPTIVVAFVVVSYAQAELKFVYFNAQSKDIEIVKAIDDDSMDLSREEVVSAFERDIRKLQAQIEEINEKRRYFEANFRAYWERIAQPAASLT